MSRVKSSSQVGKPGVSGRKAMAKGKAGRHEVAEEVFTPEAAPRWKSAPVAGAMSWTWSGGANSDKTWQISCLDLYHASPLERISLVKQGVPALEVKQLLADLHIEQGVGLRALNLSTATVNKKAKVGEVLSSDESERVIGFAKLVGQLEAMVEESGDGSGFDAHTWIARWLTEPLPAFGGARPIDLIDTMEGQGMVSSALAKLQSGAYA
jgi:putative toxin-antitoxin system antitoxin component (TIGR02293 family)